MNMPYKEVLETLSDVVRQASLSPPEPEVVDDTVTATPEDQASGTDMPLFEVIDQSIDALSSAFEQMQQNSDQLTQEILDCYNQLNRAFSVTHALSQCNSVQMAVHTLMREIGRAVGFQFSLFVGSSTISYSLFDLDDPDQEHVLTLDLDQEESRPYRFYRDHKEELERLAKQTGDCGVTMIDYNKRNDLDFAGRGNVMIICLAHNDPSEPDLGTLFFVRSADQDPFLAIDMNLANSLARLGSVLLGNILYSQKIHRNYLQTIMSLVRAMEAKDAYTGGHSNRVAELACELGRRIGLDEEELRVLEWAGLLHDIGKIGIREEVLCKEGKLTKEEFDHIKTHPVKSYQVLEPVEALHCILGAVRHHHEHWDGKGYPDALAGEEIPLQARIIQVADIWDALTSTRSYRPAMSGKKAMSILREEAGTTMDPGLVEIFLNMIEEMGLSNINMNPNEQ